MSIVHSRYNCARLWYNLSCEFITFVRVRHVLNEYVMTTQLIIVLVVRLVFKEIYIAGTNCLSIVGNTDIKYKTELCDRGLNIFLCYIFLLDRRADGLIGNHTDVIEVQNDGLWETQNQND